MERRSRVRFAPSEITRMESLVADRKEQVLDENFCQKLAKEFNRSAGRVGSRALQAIQVQGWFLNKFPASITKPTCLPTATEEKALDSQANMLVSETKALASEEKLLALDTSISNNEDEVSPDSPKGTRDKVPELDDLEFEARSAKDSAWYDIDIFLAHRRTNSGEVEVRVRFQGFGAEEDEWVNVRKAIRQRSIPLESSECQSVVEGDLVLCFRERNEEALHFDAHILEIQRKQHDIRGCRCVFLVKYDHDQSQGVYIARALDSILCVINCNTRTEILRHPDLQKLPVFLMPGKGEPEKIVTAAEVLLMAFVIVDLLLAMCAAAYIELTGTSKIVRN